MTNWDYLVITAANHAQAEAYEAQLRLRRSAGELAQVRHCLVIPDLGGRRIGSGGSTLHCLLAILRRECPPAGPATWQAAESALRRLRILIIHAGGDARRLPAYSHCGKMFVPLPAAGTLAGTTLFDRLVPIFLALPATPAGQILVASGDALILFDPLTVNLSRPGLTALATLAPAQEAAHHGVFCANPDATVRRFLQKPSPRAQAEAGATDSEGNSLLDLGVMSTDAHAAVQLLQAFCDVDPAAAISWRSGMREVLDSHGIDLYREICCALGTAASLGDYLASVRGSGSRLPQPLLEDLYHRLHPLPLHVETLPGCQFLHFGTTRQLLSSGAALLAHSGTPGVTQFVLNSEVTAPIAGTNIWIEGCRIHAPLTLGGHNALVGLDVAQPLSLPPGACLDRSAGRSRTGTPVCFLRFHGMDDTYKHALTEGATFCGTSLAAWLAAAGLSAAEVWDPALPAQAHTLWNARLVLALEQPESFDNWLWLFHPASATTEQRRAFAAADRYTCAEVALLLDQDHFYQRRAQLRATGAMS